MDIGHSPHCAEGGESNYLSLFIEENNRLRPVLKDLAMSSWQITEGSGSGCGNTDYTTDTVERTLELADTATHGWRDLQVVEHHQIDRMSATAEEAPENLKKTETTGD